MQDRLPCPTFLCDSTAVPTRSTSLLFALTSSWAEIAASQASRQLEDHIRAVDRPQPSTNARCKHHGHLCNHLQADQPKNSYSDVMANREALILRAKLAEQAERFVDMANAMKAVAQMDILLTNEERNMLAVAYKNVAGSRRSAWQVVAQLDEQAAESATAEQAHVTSQFRHELATEVTSICNDVLDLIETYILKQYEDADDEDVEAARTKVFYHKMRGDYLRYLAEVADGDKQLPMIMRARDAFETAHAVALSSLSATDPIRLGLALNFSVFAYEIENKHADAIALAHQAFDHAIAELGSIEEDTYKDSTLIMQLLRDNLTMWGAAESAVEESSEPEATSLVG